MLSHYPAISTKNRSVPLLHRIAGCDRTCNPTLKRNYEADRDVIGCQDIEEIISICPRISVINLADFKTESN